MYIINDENALEIKEKFRFDKEKAHETNCDCESDPYHTGMSKTPYLILLGFIHQLDEMNLPKKKKKDLIYEFRKVIYGLDSLRVFNGVGRNLYDYLLEKDLPKESNVNTTLKH